MSDWSTQYPKNREEETQAVEHFWAQLTHSSPVTQASLATRLNTLLGVRMADNVRMTRYQIESSSSQLAKSLGNLQRALDERMADFTTSTDASSKLLAKWTRVQAAANVVLAVLTVGLLATSAIQAIDIWQRWYGR